MSCISGWSKCYRFGLSRAGQRKTNNEIDEHINWGTLSLKSWAILQLDVRSIALWNVICSSGEQLVISSAWLYMMDKMDSMHHPSVDLK
jgi:hypothetical protein